MCSETNNNELIIYPNAEWFLYRGNSGGGDGDDDDTTTINDDAANKNADDTSTTTVPLQLNFPPLRYRRVAHLKLPHNPDDVVLGGSYNIFCGLPLYLERCAILENLYMPYILNTRHFQVLHSVLLWPAINLSAYTYLPDPQRVYFKKEHKFVATMEFDKDYITITELDSDFEK